jgi:O-antigen/teichoic acid export membrane protein
VGILAFAGCANLLLTVATAILVAADKPKWTAALAVPMPIILSVLLIFIIPRYGATGAAVSAAAVSTIASVAALVAVRVAWSVSPPLTTLGRALLLAIFGYVASAVCPGKGVFLFVKLAVLGCAVVAGFYAMGEIEKHEVWFARNLVGVFRKQAVA